LPVKLTNTRSFETERPKTLKFFQEEAMSALLRRYGIGRLYALGVT